MYITIDKIIVYTKVGSGVNIKFELFSHWCYNDNNRSSNSIVINLQE